MNLRRETESSFFLTRHSMTEQIRTTCNRDCPDSCGIVAEVEDGRIVKHKGDPAHGVTGGFLCYRGNHYLERFYSESRILHPRRRARGGWERISWDDALDLTAEKLAHYRDLFGPCSIAFISYSGIKGQVARLLSRKFWAHFGGATFLKGGTSVEAAHAAQGLDFGGPCAHAPEDLENSAGFVAWGKNIATTRVHWWPIVSRARKNGAKLWVIDPVTCATASKADRHLAIRPGSDAMLAAGLGRLLIEQGAVDEEFIAKCSVGFEEYREAVLSVDLNDVADATGIPLGDIGYLARFYAETKPLASMVGLGPSYWKNGGSAVRLIDALSALTGNVGISGGGVQTDSNGGVGLDLSLFDDVPESRSRQIALPRLGDEILAAEDPPVKMGFVAGANPAATCPDTGRVLEGLDSLEFIVAVEQFMTATAGKADLVLPCTTYLEMDDLVTAYGHYWLGLDQQVVPPLGEARSDSAVFQALADRLGFGSHLAGDPKEWIDRLLAPLTEQGITRERLAESPLPNPAATAVPFSDRTFDTPSGKFEFITRFDLPSLSLEPGRLRLVATKTLKMVNAQINEADLPAEPVVRAHPEIVSALGVFDGEQIVVESRTGSVRARLKCDEAQLREVLLFNPAAWQGSLQGVNQLRESAMSDMGDAAAMHETLVTIRKSTAPVG